ncbi:DsbA family oxidoreductase [Nocardioides sp. CER19]|uniref:DsbA family oxidoreductase n=1 Tax=Nocardioides sp. CER19 TaxID=3038538 RepID=UPI0024484049|nr:DsbA family oxidoreductase [Nocardioides sp. CER19]MDH2413804.1 DsbA family oxidoreductase [Nocardioides sp. CER19]
MSVQEAPVVIEMWTDLGCPWCYVGKHRLQAAIDRRTDAGRFVVRLRSFELNPDAPREPETIESAFIRSHGGDASVVLDAERRIQALARGEGLAFSLDRLNANTFDFHRVLHHADEQGLGTEFFSAVQDQLFAGAINPFDPVELVQVAESVGLDGERVRRVLASDEYAEETHADRREGLALGLTGVPFVVFDRQVAAPGAQSVEVYGQILDQIVGQHAQRVVAHG